MLVWQTVNNCLHLGQCPGGVELGASAETPKIHKVRKRKNVLIPDTHTSSVLAPVPLIHTFLHIGRIRNTFSWVCEAAPHTKKHLGTGLVGLQRIHICPVQAIGIQSFTLSNATKREQSRPALFSALAAPLWEGLFCWANNEAVNTHFYCSTRGISSAKDGAARRVSGRLYYPSLKCWLGGWESVQTDRWMDRWTDGGMGGCWSEECFSYFRVLLLVARSSTPPRQNGSGVDSPELRELSAAQWRQFQ